MKTKYLRNTWYSAGWAHDLGDEARAIEIIETPLVIFRASDGKPQALHDQCPHRFAPLSRGKIIEGDIRCGYHGLRFNGKGVCTHNPWSERIPSSANVQSFPVVELDGIIWVWMGEASKADEAKIRRYPELVDKNYRFVFGYTCVAAHYELIADNLLDLLHSPFLHPGFGEDWFPEHSWRIEGTTVYSDYVAPSFQGSEYTDTLWPQTDGKMIDNFESVRWDPPCLMELRGYNGVDGMNVMEEEGFLNAAPHILTPQNAASTHYFWASGIRKSESTVSDADHLALVGTAFELEDAPMLQGVQERVGSNTDMLAHKPKPVTLPGDVANVQARRILKKLIKADFTK